MADLSAENLGGAGAVPPSIAQVRATRLRPPTRKAKRGIAAEYATMAAIVGLCLLVLAGANDGEQVLSRKVELESHAGVLRASSAAPLLGDSDSSAITAPSMDDIAVNGSFPMASIEVGGVRRLAALREGMSRPATAPGGEAARRSMSGRRHGSGSGSNQGSNKCSKCSGSKSCSKSCSSYCTKSSTGSKTGHSGSKHTCHDGLKECLPGTYKRELGSSGTGVIKCKPCGVDKWCPGGMEIGPIECGPHKTTNGMVGASSWHQCVCKPGYWEFPWLGICMPCHPGYFCPGGGSWHQCPGPLHTMLTEWRATSESECECRWGQTPCEDGECTGCKPCAAGEYKDTVGNTQCTSCPSQSSTAGEGAYCLNQCVCDVGFYKNSSDAVVCQPCREGHFCINEEMMHCPAHAVSPAISTNLTDCFCPPGYFGGNGTSCEECDAGSWCPGYGKLPVDCPAGSASTVGAHLKTNCTLLEVSCPAHAVAPDGSTSISDCACLPGYHEVGNACVACPENSYCLGNKSAPVACPGYSTSRNTSSTKSACSCNDGYHPGSIKSVAGNKTTCEQAMPLNTLVPVPVTNFNLQYMGISYNEQRTETTFSYIVSAACLGGADSMCRDLKHWVLGFDTSSLDIGSASSAIGQDFDLHTCMSGVTFETELQQGLSRNYSITLSGYYRETCDYPYSFQTVEDVGGHGFFAQGITCGPSKAVDVCSECTSGTWCAGGQAFLCPVGGVSPARSTSTEDCECPNGFRHQMSPSACVPCAENTYCEHGLEFQCPLNTTSPALSSSADDCTCAPGFYLVGSACQECPAGTFKDVSGNHACTPCAVGSYSPIVGAKSIESCLWCPCSSTTLSEGSSKGEDCQCIAGYFSQFLWQGRPVCTKCWLGKFKTSIGNHRCERCPEGSFAPSRGFNTSCISCAEYGNNYVSSSDRRSCVCPAGHSLIGGVCSGCPAGSYKTDVGSGVCTLCEAGKYSGQVNALNASVCTACPEFSSSLPGSTLESNCSCVAGYSSDGTACVACGKGTYSPDGVSCLPCPEDAYCPEAGAPTFQSCPADSSTAGSTMSTKESDCICDAGYEDVFVDQVLLKRCQACKPGFYKSSAGSHSCTPCPSGHYSGIAAATSLDACISCYENATSVLASDSDTSCQCVAGYYPVWDSSDGSWTRTCAPCKAGMYKPTAGQTSCMISPANHYSEFELGSTQALKCPTYATSRPRSRSISLCKCNPGYGLMDTEDLYACVACEPGYYKARKGNHKCRVCPRDKYCPPTPPGQRPILCPPRSRTLGNGQWSIDSCVCRRGAQGSGRAGNCTLCPVGQYKNTLADGSCEACPANSYADQVGHRNCKRCPPRHVAPPGSSSIDSCKCMAGFYRSACGACLRCRRGSYCHSENIYQCQGNATSGYRSASQDDCKCLRGFQPDGHGNCVPCRIGSWKRNRGNHECSACPGGMTTLHPMSYRPWQCKCEAGSYRNWNYRKWWLDGVSTDVAVCKACPNGFWCSGNRKYRCPPNSNSAANSTSLSDCTCDAQYYVGNSSEAACSLCRQDRYCPGNGTEYHCPANTTTRSYGNDQISDCKCVQGHSGDAIAGCTPCPADSPDCDDGPSCPENAVSKPGSPEGTDCLCRDGFVANASNHCNICPENWYCPGLGDTMLECSFATSPEGSNDPTDCVCVPGYKYTQPPATVECVPCEENIWCVAGVAYECPGNSSSNAMSGDFLDCNCNDGFEGSASIGCSECQDDFWCTNGTRYACPANSVSPALSSSADDCTCAPGFYLVGSACQECPAGTFKDVSGNHACTPCAVGSYSPIVGAQSNESCVACPSLSTTVAEGSLTPEDCQCIAGYSPQSGDAMSNNGDTDDDDGDDDGDDDDELLPPYPNCMPCSAGTFKGETGNFNCSDCPAGTFLSELSSTSNTSCVACPANSVSTAGARGNSSCICNPGFAYENGICTACAAGTFKSDAGNHGCFLCYRGSYSSTVAATDISTCVSCPAFTYSLSGSQSQAECQPTSFKLAKIGQQNPLVTASNIITVSFMPNTDISGRPRGSGSVSRSNGEIRAKSWRHDKRYKVNSCSESDGDDDEEGYCSTPHPDTSPTRIIISGLDGAVFTSDIIPILTVTGGNAAAAKFGFYGNWSSGDLTLNLRSDMTLLKDTLYIFAFKATNSPNPQVSPIVKILGSGPMDIPETVMEYPGEPLMGVQLGSDPLHLTQPVFAISTAAQNNPVASSANVITVSLMSNCDLLPGSSVTVSGLVETQTESNTALQVAETHSGNFEPTSAWNKDSGQLVLHASNLAEGSELHVFNFTLSNVAADQASPTVSVSGQIEVPCNSGDAYQKCVVQIPPLVVSAPNTDIYGVENGRNALEVCVPKFTALYMSQSNYLAGQVTTLTVEFQTNIDMIYGTSVQITGLKYITTYSTTSLLPVPGGNGGHLLFSATGNGNATAKGSFQKLSLNVSQNIAAGVTYKFALEVINPPHPQESSAPNMSATGFANFSETVFDTTDDLSFPGRTICPAGTYNPLDGTSCLPCPVASYSSAEGLMGVETCQPCFKNSSSPPGSTSSLDCSCLDGFEGEPGSDCVECPPGTWCVGGVLQECGANSHSPARSYEQSSCTCIPGYSPVGIDGPCEACAIDTFKFAGDNSSCMPCPLGSTAYAEGSRSCMACPPGTYTTGNDVDIVNMCALNAPTCGETSDCVSHKAICTCSSGCKLLVGLTCLESFAEDMPPTFHNLETVGDRIGMKEHDSDVDFLWPGCTSDAIGGWCPSGESCVAWESFCGDIITNTCPDHSPAVASTCSSCPKNSISQLSSDSVTDCMCVPGYIGYSRANLSQTDDGFDDQCTPCPPGTFKDVLGPGTCSPCPANTYSPSTAAVNQTSCIQCPPDSASPASSDDITDCTCDAGFKGFPPAACVPCEEGEWCNKGHVHSCPQFATSPAQSQGPGYCVCIAGYTPKYADGPCIPCSQGTYKSTSGNESCSVCTASASTPMSASTNISSCKCSPGFYGVASSEAGTCQECPNEDTICPGGASYFCANNTNMTDCSCLPGFRRFEDAADCTLCPQGVWCPGLGDISFECAPNSTSPFGSVYQSDCVCLPGFSGLPGGACTLCPANTYCDDGVASTCPYLSVSPPGSNDRLDCKCPDGYSGLDGEPCDLCPADFYCPNPGNDVIPCPTHASSPEGSYLVDQCVCDEGFKQEEDGTCSVCASGGYCTGGVSYNCPANSTSTAGSSSLADCQCLEGYYGSSSTLCNICEAGSYCIGGVIKTCPANTFNSAGSSSIDSCICNAGYTLLSDGSCGSCPAGTYKGERGSANCTLCPEGTFSERVASKSSWNCESCPAFSSSQAGAGSKAACKCNPGYSGNNGQECTACPLDTFKPEIGPYLCTNCSSSRPNTGTVSEASTDLSQCICQLGYYEFGDSCAQCPPGQYKDFKGPGQCSKCLPGTYSPGLAMTNETEACVPCPPLTWSQIGSGDFTECDAVVLDVDMCQFSPFPGAINFVTLKIKTNFDINYASPYSRDEYESGGDLPESIRTSFVIGGFPDVINADIVQNGLVTFGNSASKFNEPEWSFVGSTQRRSSQHEKGNNMKLTVARGEKLEKNQENEVSIAFVNPSNAMTAPDLWFKMFGRISTAWQSVVKTGLPLYGVPKGSDPIEITVPIVILAAIGQSHPLAGVVNTLTVTLQMNADLPLSSTLTISGMVDNDTPDGPLAVVSEGGTGAFLSPATWTQESGTLVLQVSQAARTSQANVASWQLKNPPKEQDWKTTYVSGEVSLMTPTYDFPFCNAADTTNNYIIQNFAKEVP